MAIHANRWWALIIVTSALFLIVIDMTVLYAALPTLAQSLHTDASQKLWIMNIYPLVVTGLLPLSGQLGDRIGHRRLFLAGLPVFGLASACAAFAPSAAGLIAARAFLAVGAAMMMPASLAIVRHAFADPAERMRAIGIWAAIASSGAAFGPVLGGVLLEHFWWGSVFLINIPVAAAAWLAGLALLPCNARLSGAPLDVKGTLQAMLGLTAGIAAIKEIGKSAPDWTLAALLALSGGLLLLCFVRRQQSAAQPMLNFDTLRHPAFRGGLLVALIASVTLAGAELALTQRWQLLHGYSPLQSALALLPLPVACALSAGLTDKLMRALGGMSTMRYALGLCCAGLLALLATANAGAHWQIACLALVGAGVGAAMTTSSNTVMQHAHDEESGATASLEDLAYEFGSVLGITLLGGLLAAIYSAKMAAAPALAADSIDAALSLARILPGEPAFLLLHRAFDAFEQGYRAVLLAAIVLLAITGLLLPDERRDGVRGHR